jgi:hypothetical protein
MYCSRQSLGDAFSESILPTTQFRFSRFIIKTAGVVAIFFCSSDLSHDVIVADESLCYVAEKDETDALSKEIFLWLKKYLSMLRLEKPS